MQKVYSRRTHGASLQRQMNRVVAEMLKNVKKRTAVQLNLHCGATIGALWTKFICTAVRFLTYFFGFFVNLH